MKAIALAASLALLATSSCQKIECNDPEPPPPAGTCVMLFPTCDSNVICTMDFRSVDVRILRPDSSAAALDSFYVTDAAGAKLPPVNGVDVYGPHMQSGPGPADGRHAVINDLWVAGHQQTQTTVYAKGWKSGALVINQSFGIGADCCHVYKTAGPDVITVPD